MTILGSANKFLTGAARPRIRNPAESMERFSYRCDCILPVDHPLAKLDVITPTELDQVPFISLFRDHTRYGQLATAFSSYNAKWNVVAEVQYFATVCELVAAGCGVGLVDPIISSPFTGEVVRRRFEPAILYEIGLLHPDISTRSVISEEFLALLRTHLADQQYRAELAGGRRSRYVKHRCSARAAPNNNAGLCYRAMSMPGTALVEVTV
jgi:DNA-binding transcriptional LysR family regulator